jgi:branched-subunit amino acid transport protein
MALVTYLIRMLPITLLRRKIENRLFRSFLYYIPYAVLAAMIVPDMLFATRSLWSGAAALAAGVALALRGQKLLTVAIVACAAVFVAELLMKI